MLILKQSCVSYLVVRKKSVYILKLSYLSCICIANIFSFSTACVFMLSMVSVGEQKVFYFNEIQFIIFFLLWFALHVLCIRNSCLLKVANFFSIFSFTCFNVVLACTIRSVIDFVLICICSKIKNDVFSFHVEASYSSTIC